MIRRQTAGVSNIFVKKNRRDQRISRLTRAEAVRQRREEQVRKPAEREPRPEAKTNPNAVPYTMRSGAMGTPLLYRAKSGARRQVAFSMGKTGTEVMMPSLPIIKPGWRLVSGFLFLTLSIFLGLVLTAPEFKVTTVEVSGLQRISAQDLTTALQVSGKPIFLIDLNRVQEDITSLFTELTDVKVSVAFPAKLMLSVTERQPYIEWHYNDMVSWIDEKGYIFPVRGQAQPVFVVIADTPPPLQPIPTLQSETDDSTEIAEETNLVVEPESNQSNLVDPVFLQGIRTLHEQMPLLTTISYRQNDGYGWQDENNWNVFVGFDLANLDQKLLVYQAIKQKLLSEGIYPNMVNVAYVHAPFYRMEP